MFDKERKVMRQLFDMDAKNYSSACRRFVRPSARGVILREDKLQLVYVSKVGYYKFPGGGIDPEETPEKALVREVREEAGLVVIPGSIREYGLVHRLEYHAEHGDLFDQKNYYFFCEAEPGTVARELTESEQDNGFVPIVIEPEEALKANLAAAVKMREKAKGFDRAYGISTEIEREGRVIELLLQEGYFGIYAGAQCPWPDPYVCSAR